MVRTYLFEGAMRSIAEIRRDFVPCLGQHAIERRLALGHTTKFQMLDYAAPKLKKQRWSKLRIGNGD